MMRIVKCFVFIMIVSIVNSCKKNDFTKEITITLDLIVKYDDNFQIFYNDSFYESYSENRSRTVKIVGDSLNYQKVQFKFPKGYIPSRVRIDLGDNEKQKSLILNEITISVNNNSKNYSSLEMLEDFEFNENLNFDTKTGEITFKDNGKIHDPFFISKNLYSVFKKLIN